MREKACAMLLALSSSTKNPLNFNVQNKEGNTALHIASTLASNDTLSLLLEKNADPNIQNMAGNTPLHLACKINAPNIARRLLQDTRINVNLKNKEEGNTAIHIASTVANEDILSLLLDKYSDPNIQNMAGDTPLHIACKMNAPKIVKRILQDSRINVNLKNAVEGNTALHIASTVANEDILSLLLEKNADPNIQNMAGNTSLHTACKMNAPKIVKRLLQDSRINVNLKNAVEGNTALHIASTVANEDILSLLLEKNADPNIQNMAGNTPLQIACKMNAPKIVKRLLQDSRINANLKNTLEGNTAMHIASTLAIDDILSLLLEKYADPNIQNMAGDTPLHIACKMNAPKIVRRLLQDIRINMNLKNTVEGNTAMHIASTLASEDILSILLAKYADPNIQNMAGDTPLHIASRNIAPKIVKRLLQDCRTEITLKNKEGKAANQINTTLAIQTEFLSMLLTKHQAARGRLEIALGWSNLNDLDLHVTCPHGYEINYSNKESKCCNGKLDVDMNAGSNGSEQPVEHIYWEKNPAKGKYKVEVKHFAVHTKPEVTTTPFHVKISIDNVTVWETSKTIYTVGHTEHVISFTYPDDLKFDSSSKLKLIC